MHEPTKELKAESLKLKAVTPGYTSKEAEIESYKHDTIRCLDA